MKCSEYNTRTTLLYHYHVELKQQTHLASSFTKASGYIGDGSGFAVVVEFMAMEGP